MKRRDFIKTSMLLSILGARLPLMALGKSKQNIRRKTGTWDSDRILVLIKMDGGNDGLNSVIPVYDNLYHQKRPTLAFNANQALMVNEDSGFHPQMAPLIPIFQNGEMGIIHGVGYPQGNLSHFRSSDIWVTGSPADEIWSSGWLGRLFQNEYPNFPDGAPEHPIAIQFNSANLLEFQSTQTNFATMLFDPDVMYYIVNENYVPGSNDPPPETYGGDELNFVRELDLTTLEYSEEIYGAGQDGDLTVEYPNNNLGEQLAVTAKLISGGLMTPIYRLNIGGFDTHAGQAGEHPSLLNQMSNAISAFLQDLKNQGLDDRVMVVTTSEFGRRVEENGSNGTDHGTSGPIFTFGTTTVGNVFGSQPSLSNLDNNENLMVEHDFRQVYTTLIEDWFGLDPTVSQAVFQETFEPIPFVANPLSVSSSLAVPEAFTLYPAFPNPFNPATNIRFELPHSSKVTIQIFDIKGREVRTHRLGKVSAGLHDFRLDCRDLSSGVYHIQVETAGSVQSQRVTLLK